MQFFRLFGALRSVFLSGGAWPMLGMLLLLTAPVCTPALAQPASGPPLPPVEVGVIEVRPQDTPAVYEFTGQTESSREVEIRARVSGYLDKIAYNEGDRVRQGQLLFQLDPRPFQAALNNARGGLAQQQAKLKNAQATLRRVQPLARENAVSQKDLDDATDSVAAAQAAVQSAQAQVDEAKINLDYATIRSPLTGIASRSQSREGSLVSAGQSLLTTVVQLDPIWVNFGVGENAVLRYREQVASGEITTPGRENIEVELVLADASVYPHKGRLDYVAPTVDQRTGTLAMRAAFPNPQRALNPNARRALSPGQFVRVRLKGMERSNIILVLQRAVLQGANSKFAFVVGADNIAQVRNIEVGEFYGDQWIVTSGLNAGDKVIVDGAIKVRPGAPVKIAAPAAAPPNRS